MRQASINRISQVTQPRPIDDNPVQHTQRRRVLHACALTLNQELKAAWQSRDRTDRESFDVVVGLGQSACSHKSYPVKKALKVKVNE